MNHENNTFRSAFQTKAFKAGGYSMLLAVIVTAAVVILNLLVGILPSGAVKFDMSGNDIYAVSDATREIVKNIKADVTVYQIAPQGSENKTISEFVRRYHSMNSRIKLEIKDPELYPTFVAQYTEETLNANSLIVVNEETGRAKCIDYSSVYYLDYSSLTQEQYYYAMMGYDMSAYATQVFAGESELTSALDYVTTESVPVIYEVQGHGETALGSGFQSLISTDNIDRKELDLKTVSAVPDDATLLVMNVPLKDITEEEKSLLSDYMAKGGKLMLVTDYQNGKLENLSALAEAYALHYEDGVVLEGSSSRYQQYPYYVFPKIESSDYTAKLAAGSYVFMPFSHGISVDASPAEGLTVTKLLTTSDQAYIKSEDDLKKSPEKADGDLTGPFCLGVLSKNQNGGGIVWFSSPYFAKDELLSYYSNGQAFSAVTGVLCDKKVSVSIATKSLSTEYLNVSSAAQSVWFALLVVLVPVAALSVGFVVWNKRRKA